MDSDAGQATVEPSHAVELLKTTTVRRRRQQVSVDRPVRSTVGGGLLRSLSALGPRPRRWAYFTALVTALWILRRCFQQSYSGIRISGPARASRDPLSRKGSDALDSVDPAYRPFVPLDAPDPPFPRLLPTKSLPSQCLDRWFSEGELVCDADEVGAEEKVDATWLWVNGSDPRWRESMEKWRAQEGIYSPEHHFREQNELVYTIRSVIQALPAGVGTAHLVVADFDFEERDAHLLPDNLRSSLSLDNWRVAQTPTWLNFSRLDPRSATQPSHQSSTSTSAKGSTGRLPRFRYATHSEIFRLPSAGRSEDAATHAARERRWRNDALPTFNSMSIESRLGWLPGMANVTLALNDDFFLLKAHSVSTSSFGPYFLETSSGSSYARSRTSTLSCTAR